MAKREAPSRVVIVGASVAGVAVARGLRSEGFSGEIVLIGAERDWPYDKPPLSKQVLSGEWDAGQATLLTPDEASDLELDVRLGMPARELSVASRQVALVDGTIVSYEACVIATGSSPRPSPWPERPGVHVLRTLQDAVAIHERFLIGGPVAVVGGGFIGAEVASSARALGIAVTIIDPLELPMAHIVGTEPARLFTGLAERNGIELRLGHGVAGIEGTAGALTVRLTDGSSLSAGTAVVGIGVQLNDAWLASSGLLLEDGVICDRFCRAIGADDVFAAGDIARWHHPELDSPFRVEHWTNAVDQAACVAHNVAHPDDQRPYAPIPYVWSDQHGWKFQIVGQPAGASRYEVVGDLGDERPRAAVVYVDTAGRITGAFSVNWPRALSECRQAIAAHSYAESVVRPLSERLAGALRP